MTQLDLARALAANQSTVAYWENGRSEPDSERIKQLAQILGTSPAWLMFGTPGLSSPATTYANDLPLRAGSGGRDLPVRGLAQASAHDALSLSDTPVAYTERPPQLIGNGQAFAVWVAGRSMEPRFRPGEIVLVNPNKPLTPGCCALLECKDGSAFIKEFMGENKHKISLRQYNPQRAMEIDRGKLIGLYRIVGSLED